MQPTTVVKIGPQYSNAFKLYAEGTPEWHCLVDIGGEPKTVEVLMREHLTTLDYYETYLPVLELCGAIILKHADGTL